MPHRSNAVFLSAVTITALLAVLQYAWVHNLTLSFTSSLAEAVDFYTRPTKSTAVRTSRAELCLANRGTRGRWVMDAVYGLRTRKYRPAVQRGPEGRWHKAQNEIRTDLLRSPSSYVWIDDECTVSELMSSKTQEFCDTMNALNASTIIALGDSLTQEFALTFAAIMGIQYVFTSARDSFILVPCGNALDGTKMNDINFHVRKICKVDEWEELYQSSLPGYKNESAVNDYITQALPGSRIVAIINAGAWCHTQNEFDQDWKYMTRWMDNAQAKMSSKLSGVRASRLLAFFRSSIPGHPNCGDASRNHISNVSMSDDGGQSQEMLKSEPPLTSYEEYNRRYRGAPSRFRYWTKMEEYNEIAKKRIANMSSFFYLNTYNSTVLRHDGHPTRNSSHVRFDDCLHYSLIGPVDWWVHMWYSHMLDLVSIVKAGGDIDTL